MLSQEQITAYRTNGYITVANVITSEHLVKLRRVTDSFVEKSRLVTDHTKDFDLEPGRTSQTPQLRRLKRPERLDPAYDQVLHNESIIAMVAQLVGPNVRHFGGKLNMKSAECGSPVEWHQDFAFGSTRSNDDILAVGVALDPMTVTNGCLLVVPGSHRGPIFNHYQGDIFAGAITDPHFSPNPVKPVVLEAGDISIHHGRLLHASAANQSAGQPRRLYLLQYCAADCWRQPVSPEQMDIFKSHMVRGELPKEARTVDLPPVPRPAKPRTVRGGSIYEQQTHLEQRHFTTH